MNNGMELTREEREHVQGMLLRGESIQWTGRPLPRVRGGVTLVYTGVGTLLSVFLGCAVYRLWTGADDTPNPRLALLLTPFLLIALYCATAYLRRKLQLRRTAYILTDVRAIVLEPGLFGTRQERVYYLTPGMVRRRKAYADGSGSLVFERKRWKSPAEIDLAEDYDHTFYYEYGFLELPDLARVESLLARLIADAC